MYVMNYQKLRISTDTICRICEESNETSIDILGQYPALSEIRLLHLGEYLPRDPRRFEVGSIFKLVSFIGSIDILQSMGILQPVRGTRVLLGRSKTPMALLLLLVEGYLAPNEPKINNDAQIKNKIFTTTHCTAFSFMPDCLLAVRKLYIF